MTIFLHSNTRIRASPTIYIVTGSTDGIGQHTVGNLARLEGSTVLVHGRRAERVWSTIEDLKKDNDKVEGQ